MIGRARPAMESDPRSLKRPYCEHTPPILCGDPAGLEGRTLTLNSQDHRYWCRSAYCRTEVGIEEYPIGWIGDFWEWSLGLEAA
jgi:hypothetical protein